MQKLHRLISSPRNLFIFEVAARHGSFTRAAEELSMQQPSVSAAIKQLEASLGVKLFDRQHRKVQLTSAGQRFQAGVARALADIQNAAEAVAEMGKDRIVTLNASSAFVYFWMMPRLPDLRQKHPEIDLRLQSSDHEPDLDTEQISLAVRLGDGVWPGYDTGLIADEVLYPVASPLVFQSARTLRSIPTLLQQRLIQLEEPIRDRPTWKQWFAHHKVLDRNIPVALRLNDYAMVLQAAMAGEGFAIGWDHQVGRLIRNGHLMGRPDWAWRTGRGVYLVWSSSRALSPQAEAVRDWILDQAAKPGSDP